MVAVARSRSVARQSRTHCINRADAKATIARATHPLRDLFEPGYLGHLGRIRNGFAHDGRLEFASLDSREMHVIALNPVARLLACDEISEVKTLTESDDYIDRHVAQDGRRASMAKHATAWEAKGRGREAHAPAYRSKLLA